MALINRPFPGLFGGVSQQIPALRHPTQVEVLDNAYVSVLDGLTRRPGTRHVLKLGDGLTSGNILDNAQALNTTTHIIDQNGQRYLVMARNGDLLVWNLETGASQTVTFPDGKGYLAASLPTRSFRFLTVADYTFVVNQEIQCLATTVNNTVNSANQRYVRVLQKQTGVVYTIAVDTYSYSYTALAADDSNTVAVALAAGLDTAAGAGYTITHAGYGVISIAKATAIVNHYITDGFGETATLDMSKPIQRYSDLPPLFDSAYILTIATDEVSGAAYYVKYDNSASVGRWVETKKPDTAVVDTFTASTMPHLLIHNADGTWTFKRADDAPDNWRTRLVGDDDSNPVPSFVNGYITDVFFFRNRLGFLTADTVCLSKAGEFFDFWSDTARQVLDSDPIDVAGTSSDVYNFNYALPYNEQLLLFSENAQWDLSAAEVLSPRTVKLAVSTRYNAAPTCRPALVGSDVYFATGKGLVQNARMYRYRLSENAVTNRAEDVTAHCPLYLLPYTTKIIASASNRALLVLNQTDMNQSFFFKWEEDGDKMSQKAWGRWTLPTNSGAKTARIKDAHWVDNKLYLVTHYVHPTEFPSQYGQFCIEYIDFDDVRKWTLETPAAALEYFMDRKVTLSATSYDAGTDKTTYTLPYQDNNTGVLWKLSGADTLGNFPATAEVTVQSGGTTLVKFTGDLRARTCTFGFPYAFHCRLSEIHMQDNQGVPIPSSRLRLRRLTLAFENTGYFVVEVTPSKRSTYSYPMNGVTIGSTALNSAGIARGNHIVPVGTAPNGCTIDIKNSTTYLPTRIPYGEWVGEIIMRAAR